MLKDGTAPISKLHQDILYEIFNVFSAVFPSYKEHDAVHAIDTLRLSSQVCQPWRSLILHSPFLWGKVVHLGYNKRWLEEVIVRSCNAPLWVQGRSNYTFFSAFIGPYWPRLSGLSVEIDNFDNARGEQDLDLAIFFQPASNVSLFALKISGIRCDLSDSLANSTNELFGGIAPKLRVFKAPWLPFNIQAGWLTNIQVMEFQYRPVSQVLTALEQMPLIEKVKIKPLGPFSPVLRTHIHLPRLCLLDLRGNTTGILFLLENLTPALGCSVILSTSARRVPARNDIFQLILQQVPRYFNNCFTHQADVKVRMQFTESEGVVYRAENNHSSFSVCVASWMDLHARYLGALFIGCSHFTQTKNLELELFDYPTKRDRYEKRNILQSFLTVAFENLVHLNLNTDGLEIANPSVKILPFPMLQTLSLYSFPKRESEGTKCLCRRLVNLTMRRIEIKVPLAFLKLSFPNPSEFLDLDFLETATGLKVQWTVGVSGVTEYICGSGRRDELRIATNYSAQYT